MGNELNQIQCPNCKHTFSVTQAIAGDIQRDVERRYKIALQQKEAAIAKEHEALAKQKEEMQKSLQITLAREKALLEAKLKAELAQSASLEMQDLKMQLAEKQKQAEEFAKNELELRQKQRALEEREKQQELELQRKLDAQRLALEEDLKKRLADEFQMKSAEKDLKLETMRKQIEELSRNTEFLDPASVRKAVDVILASSCLPSPINRSPSARHVLVHSDFGAISKLRSTATRRPSISREASSERVGRFRAGRSSTGSSACDNNAFSLGRMVRAAYSSRSKLPDGTMPCDSIATTRHGARLAKRVVRSAIPQVGNASVTT